MRVDLVSGARRDGNDVVKQARGAMSLRVKDVEAGVSGVDMYIYIYIHEWMEGD